MFTSPTRVIILLSPDIALAGLAAGSPLRRALPRLVLVVLLHLGVLWLVTRPAPYPVALDQRVWVQLLRRAPPVAARQEAAPPPVRTQAVAPRSRARLPAPPPEEVAATAPATPAAQSVPATPPAPTSTSVTAEISAAPAENLPAGVVQQALKAAGAVDRELRSGNSQPLAAPAADSPGARLSRGLAAAHAALKPRWFEAARTELISAPNDPRRIYRVTTAMGEYCVFYPDKASMTANSDPRSGHASFGQPKLSSCPVPF